ncbi:abscission/NoCut checkpoint regulator-like isoform X2 [Patiria miniata]|uniref:FYVE-type domain-containing protein n=1 Tax=Patiria miniata TaxID=46514 RepID=A0A914B8E3_PATMI|nr:abscission/NoCut checkpoint regulator-like isoform X2 [Patiria miniata]
MDGKCFSCTEKFGIFRREHGCKSCGYSFCSKCLEKSIVIPGKGPKEQSVCNKCYKQLTAPPSEKADTGESQHFQEPPENFKKRIAALEKKQNEKSHPSLSEASRKRGFAKSEDRDIAERLERLKEDRKKMRGRTLSTEEIEDRLHKLKGGPTAPASTGSKTAPTHQPPDQRTPHEQTHDLLTQMHEEAAIDAKMDGTEITEDTAVIPPGNKEEDLEQEMQKLMQEAKEELKKDKEGLGRDVEIAARLAKLNTGKTTSVGERGPSGGAGMEADDEEDEEAASQRLIKQLLEQDELEARTGALGSTSQDIQPQSTTAKKPFHGGSALPDPDELPWCCICNEDATLRCHGCDDDLYCKRCFREGHDGFDLKDHETSSYRKPKAGQS